MKTKNIILIGLVVLVIIFVFILIGDHKTANAPTNISMIAETSTTASNPAASSTIPKPMSSSSAGAVRVSIVITTSTSESYANSSFSFNYPKSWSIFTISPFSMNDFNGNYYSGGIIPPGGAEIDVVTTTAYASVQSIMDTELMSAVDMTTSTVAVDGVSCNKVSYQDTYPGQLLSQNIAMYCLRGTELWKIYLSYRAHDPVGQAHVADFNSILQSMKLLTD